MVKNIHKYNRSICSPTQKFVRQDNKKTSLYSLISNMHVLETGELLCVSWSFKVNMLSPRPKPRHADAQALCVGSLSSPVGPFEAFGGFPQPCCQIFERSACSVQSPLTHIQQISPNSGRCLTTEVLLSGNMIFIVMVSSFHHVSAAQVQNHRTVYYSHLISISLIVRLLLLF